MAAPIGSSTSRIGLRPVRARIRAIRSAPFEPCTRGAALIAALPTRSPHRPARTPARLEHRESGARGSRDLVPDEGRGRARSYGGDHLAHGRGLALVLVPG